MKKQKELERRKHLAKTLVLHCFRNTHLENIHAGKKNGGVGNGFSDAEMKKLMIECVDNVYTFLSFMEDAEKIGKKTEWWINMNTTHGWNEPKLVESWLK